MIYRFGEYQLNPLARELSRHGEHVELAASAFDCLIYLVEHRKRPVGRDELISAVWGRTDVSDNLLAQTIVRLRRALGDDCIKTVARVGYRWMPETTVVSPSNPAAHGLTSDQTIERDDHAGHATARTTRGRLLAGVSLFALLVVIACFAWRTWHAERSQAHVPLRLDNSAAAIVLPADVTASGEWKWLHLGLMDLVSNKLRTAGIATENSQEVIELLKQRGDKPSDDFSSFGLVIKLRVRQLGERWQVRLDAKARDGRTWRAESSSGDVLAAARTVSDLLLAELGAAHRKLMGGSVQDDYLLRIEAAQLAGEPQTVHELIAHAPVSLRDNPELAYNSALVDCEEEKFESCEQKLTVVLKQIPDRQPLLRGKVLSRLWFVYKNKHRYAEGDAVLTEAIGLLQKQNDPAALANAYLEYSHLKYYQEKWDDATALIGQARVNYALAGDAVGLVKVDYAMALLAEHRGQIQTTAALLQRVYEQSQKLGMRVMQPYVLAGLVRAQLTLLNYRDALATTDRFWPLDQKDSGFLEKDIRLELTMVRALALASNGRTVEALTLLEEVFRSADPATQADYRGESGMWRTELALRRQDTEGAALWSSQARQFIAADEDSRDIAQTRLDRIATLLRLGQAKDVEREVGAMEAWAADVPKDDFVSVRLMHARAIGTWAEGDRKKACEQLGLAMSAAEKLGMPDMIVRVGTAYVLALLDTGNVDQAMAVGGRLSAWSNVDWRAAWAEARVYKALGRTASWEQSRSKAQQLAGDAPLPSPSDVVL